MRRATVAGLVVIGLTMAWLITACGSGGAGTNAQHAVSTAVSQLGEHSTNTDPPPAKTTTSTETQTVTEPAQTVTRTQTVQSAPPTTSISNKTTSVQVTSTPTTSTTGGQTGSKIPWWGWLLIGLGAAALAVGIFAAGHRRGARGRAGAPGTGAQGGGGMPPGPRRGP